ncbi:MAG: alpha/beta hydrolase [Planctomycetota bacterium]|nr:alpha/beta hydrolase [Planctomycetota bacterium]
MRRLIVGALLLLLLTRAGIAQIAETRRDMVFRKIDGQELKLDLYLPEGEGPHPIALVIHGGGWFRGSRRSMNATLLVKLLARDGVAGASIDYRLAPKSPHPAQIEDCRYAMQWLLANATKFGLDKKKVMACGASSGGHLAGLLGAQANLADPNAKDRIARERTRPDCVLSFFGPMDLASDDEETNAAGVRLVKQFLGVRDRSESALAAARLASPLHQLASGAPPFLFIHGKQDRLVPVEQSHSMARALKKRGVPSSVLEVRGGHGDFTLLLAASRPGAEPKYWQQARAFLKRHWLK